MHDTIEKTMEKSQYGTPKGNKGQQSFMQDTLMVLEEANKERFTTV